MEKIRKTVKVYALVTVLFFIMTLILCALISFTDFDEDWSYAGLVIILTLSTLILGFLEAKVIGTRGLIVGIISSAVFIAAVLLLIKIIFDGSTEDIKQYMFLLISLLAGGLGGVLGINSNK